MRTLGFALAGCLTLLSSVQPDAARQDDRSPGALVSAGSAYLAQYAQDITAIVAEETYLQRGPSPRPQQRLLRSDFLVSRHEALGWIEFRDVFEVDGLPVRDRTARLASLFMNPTGDAFEQAKRIVDEGARFNLGPVSRTINTPLTALRFLSRSNLWRSAFRVDASASRNGAVALRFTEQQTPRLLMTPDNAAASGTFWLDRSGRVVATELRLNTSGTTVVFGVKFAEDGRLKVWVPASMDERYDSRGGSVTGRASYSNFRRFRVETKTDIGG